MEKIEIDEGIVEIATKEEAMWMKVKESAESRLKQHEEGVIIEKAVIEMADQKIKREELKNNGTS